MQIGIIFEYPWVLALFPLLAAFVYITGRKIKYGSPVKNRVTQWLRMLLFLVLILAVSSPSIHRRAGKTVTLFIADVSDSVKDRVKSMEEFIGEAGRYATPRDETGVIAFAEEAGVIRMPGENGSDSLKGRIRSVGTNMEKALILARSVIPAEVDKRLVLLTDGKETEGNALETARLLRRLGYTLNVVPFPSGTDPEVQIEAFEAPKQVNTGERFEVSVRIGSNVNTQATIRLYGNRTLTAEKEVELYKGENLFTFTDEVKEGGMVTYTVEVTAEQDTVFQNNQLSAFAQIADQPRILLLERGKTGENLVNYLGEYAQITRMHPLEAPVSQQGLMAYDAFVLVDISAEWLDEAFLNHLEQAVQYQGKGLLVIGGENSYAPGGYRNTPLETILPVDMDIRPKEENPDLGLVLVIDKSGSMTGGQYGISKLQLAREAAVRAVEVLEENDQLGVIAFDDAIQWVIRTTPLTDKEAAVNLIGTIRPGGGTQILPPLEEAFTNLREKDTKLKHIILLTDGQAERYGYEEVIEGLRDEGITLSTVAVGQGADTLLLKALAYGGMGRYYQTDEFSDIPSIFAKEAFLAGQKYLQNRQFYPELVNSMELLKGIEAVPMLDGYVSTRAKTTSRVVFQSDIQEPILTVWQYGLGRTAAWTSDIQGVWTSQWAMWQDVPAFWGNLTGWLVQKNLNSTYTVNTEIREGSGVITLSTEDEGMFYQDKISGTLISPDGSTEPIDLAAVKPGVYEASIGKTDPGAYLIHMEVPGEEESSILSAGIVMPYSSEYRLLNDFSEEFIQRLAQAGGGKVITEPGEVFRGEVQRTGGKRDLTRFLVLLALILLLLDIAFRKLQLPMDRLILFRNEKIVPAVHALRERFIKKSKRPYSAPAPEKHPKETVQDTAVNEPIKTPEKDKKPQPKPPIKEKQIQSDDGDSINALLNRRKKWK